ncbi:MAG: inner membrane CreD family protein [Rudaea sp.]
MALHFSQSVCPMGAFALLAVVAALMYLTRKVDWYTYAGA